MAGNRNLHEANRYNPEQFEIVEFRKGNDGKDLIYSNLNGGATLLQNTYSSSTAIPGLIKNAEGKITYARILIRKKQ